MTVLSRPGCHLCTVVWELALRLQSELLFELSTQDVDRDPTLAVRYGTRIPVVLIDGVECGAGPMSEEDLRGAIKKARRSRPVSRILSRFGWSPSR